MSPNISQITAKHIASIAICFKEETNMEVVFVKPGLLFVFYREKTRPEIK